MYPVGSPWICPTSFSFIFINIYPTIVKTFLKFVNIVFAHWCKTCLNHFFSLFKRNFFIRSFHYRCINIIHMKFIHTEQLFTQCHVAVHRRHFCMNRLEQLVVNQNRDISAIQRCSQCRWIFSYICKECGLFQIGTERCGEHVFVFFILRIILLKRFFSDPAVLRL